MKWKVNFGLKSSPAHAGQSFPHRFSDISPRWMTLVWFLVILALRHDSLWTPPIWDSAMGVFPPAIYLFRNGFDVISLSQMDGWWDGGPNVHTISLLTWIIAVLMKITGSAKATILLLHLSMFAGTAWALTLFTRLLRTWSFDDKTAVAAALFVLLMPLVLVQVGRIYTEIPVLICVIAALDAHSRGNTERAAVICGIAIFFKLTAIALTASLLIALLFEPGKLDWKKARVAFLLLAAPALRLFLGELTAATSDEFSNWGSFRFLFENAINRLGMVPDLSVLLALGIAASVIGIPRILRSIPNRQSRLNGPPGMDFDQRNSMLVGMMLPPVFILCTIAQFHLGYLGLHRYYVPVIPFALATVLFVLKEVHLQKYAFIILLVICIFFLMNQNGYFYPREWFRFSVVERSDELERFHEAQIEGIEMLKNRPAHIPVGISREIDYMISDPMMGYVDQAIPNTFSVYVKPYSTMSLAEFPDEFMLLKTNQFHGGKQIRNIVSQATKDSAYSITEITFRNPWFRSVLYTIRRENSTQAEVN